MNMTRRDLLKSLVVAPAVGAAVAAMPVAIRFTSPRHGIPLRMLVQAMDFLEGRAQRRLFHWDYSGCYLSAVYSKAGLLTTDVATRVNAADADHVLTQMWLFGAERME